jgi:hypothetical protein
MPEIKQLQKRLDFSSFPLDWRVTSVSVDWEGEPLVLLGEGKLPRPDRDADIDTIVKWMNSPPKRHHLLHWHEGTVSEVSFENPMGLVTTTHIQPFEDGWLLAEGRGGLAQICDKNGHPVRTLDLGDASEHVQTTPDGHIWVGYFDEGVYGRGIGSAGLVCFESSGTPVFKYDEFARQHDIPCIDDCYTLNVSDSAVWLSYYADFPLVCLKNFELEQVWHSLGPNLGIAIRGDRLIIFPAYDKPYLVTRTLENPDTNIWELADADGRFLSKLAGGPPETTGTSWYVPFQVAARHGRVYLYDETALHELP